jgi:tetratricopeptide (TPR) repeat protein
MDSGSVQEIAKRLKSWCSHNDRGLARVEWDSARARQQVVDELKGSLDKAVTSVVEIELPAGEESGKVVATLIDTLRSLSGSVASITGIEWAFPDSGERLGTLAGLSFQREFLASLPVRQIWWVPSTLIEQFVLGVPDLDSWFQLRLHLTEIPAISWRGDEVEAGGYQEARALQRRFWERFDAAQAQGIPQERIWRELAEPAVDALISAGLAQEAEAIVMRAPNIRPELERMIEKIASTRGAEDHEVLTLKGGLARFLIDRGDSAGARKLQEEVLEVMTRVEGEEKPATLRSMNELAGTLVAQGDLAAARRLEERAVEVTARVFGDEHPSTLASMNNLASTLKAQGDLSAARRLQERVLEIRMRMLGEERLETLTSINNLALTVRAQGDLTGARRLQERVLDISRRVLGDRHPTTLRSMTNLGSTINALGDFAKAAAIEREALQGNMRMLGEEHPDTMGALNNLALTLRAQGDLPGARLLQEQALAVSQRVLGETHPVTLRSMTNLALTLSELGDANAARRLEDRVVALSTPGPPLTSE